MVSERELKRSRVIGHAAWSDLLDNWNYRELATVSAAVSTR
ncbi:hypothetical protein PT276_10675 [Orbaceae bacterium ESL0721]|nr:hypothetical protein [Orbaceae bacterium ESL0721]